MKYKIGMVLSGTITGLQPYGAFVSLDEETPRTDSCFGSTSWLYQKYLWTLNRWTKSNRSSY